MGYLDELKKQAEQAKIKEEQEKNQAAELERKFRTEVLPAMKKLFHYLYEMVSHLKAIKPDILMTYHIEGFGKAELRQKDYIFGKYKERTKILKTESLSHDEVSSFFLRLVCQTTRKVKIERNTPEDVETQREYLWRNNIPHDYKQINDNKYQFLYGIFELSGEIYPEFRFITDFQQSLIKIEIKNFEGFTRQEYLLDSKEITSEFLDGLAQYITCKNPNPNFLKRYDAKQVWARRNATPEQLLRQQILEELERKQKEEANQRKAQQELAQQQKLKEQKRQASLQRQQKITEQQTLAEENKEETPFWKKDLLETFRKKNNKKKNG